MNGNWKNVLCVIGRHCRIFGRGLVRTCYGAATAGLVGIAVYGFLVIGGESGWVAVCDFIATIATATVALTCMYAMGAGVKKGAKR